MAAAEKPGETPAIGLWLEVDLDSEPISGSIRVADEAPKPFVGWLGLTALLEAVRQVRSPQKMTGRGVDKRLTRAEREIVELVCEGLTNPQIAQRLSVSPRTVQGALLRVFRKFDVSTRAQLVARMLRAQNDENATSGFQGSGSAKETFTT